MLGSGVIWALLRRPRLWAEAVRTVGALASRSWWRNAPRLPVPEPTYAAWRRATAYGSEEIPIAASDLVDFLEWRRRFRVTAARSASHG